MELNIIKPIIQKLVEIYGDAIPANIIPSPQCTDECILNLIKAKYEIKFTNDDGRISG